MPLSNNHDSFKFQQRFMTFTGLWPYRDASKVYKIYGVFNYLLVLTLAISFLISTLVSTGFAKLLQSWSMFVAIINCSIKFTIFYFKMPTFLDLLDFLRSPHFSYYNEKYDNHLQEQIKFSSQVTLFFAVCGSTTVLLMLYPKEARQSPLPFPINFSNYSIIVYILVYLFQICALSSAATSSYGFDNLSTSMMGLSTAYFKVLRDTILSITNIDTEKSQDIYCSYKEREAIMYQQLSECVGHHVAVIKLAETVEDIFTYVFLSQFLNSALGMCLVGSTLVNAPIGSLEFVFSLSFLSTLMFQITLYCSFGNEVTLRSAQIRDACYFMEWIYCGKLVRTPLFLIMERAKRPTVLSAGKFIDLSLTSLVAVFRSAISYAAVLRQMQAKQ